MELKSKRIKLGEGIYLNLIENDKFKSNLLSCYFTRPLNREEVTKNALLPLILRSGSKNYPSNLEVEKRLEELYGANLSVSVNKRGEKHIIRHTMEWAKGDYLKDPQLDYEVIDTLWEIIFNPLKDGEKFSSEVVNREKENLRKIIEGKINNKRTYAIEKCLEEMCKTEKFSIYQLGYVEDLKTINEENLYRHYEELIKTSPIEFFYVGHYDDDLVKYLEKKINIARGELVTIPESLIMKSPQNKKVIRELMDVNQGKLVIGYRAGIKHDDPLYNPLLVASEIFGGGPNSKLFKHVREEASLAYYIGSTIFKYKSILLVDGGIEFGDYDKAVEIIGKQLSNLKEGNFTEGDIDIAIKSIITSTESIKDSIFLISEFFFSKHLAGDDRSLEEILEGFEKVTKDEIIEAANEIKIDTIYFMDKYR